MIICYIDLFVFWVESCRCRQRCDFVKIERTHVGCCWIVFVLTSFSGSLFSPIKNKETHFHEAHSGLTPNDSTSNFQQGPNNPIPVTRIIILWVLNDPVDYWSVQSHKDLQRLQGHLIYWVLWLKFPVSFFTTIISSYTCSPSKRCEQKPNKARVGTLSLCCGLYFPFGYIKPFFGDQKSKTLEKRVWKFVCVCVSVCVCVHWGWGNNWHSMVRYG